MKIRWLMFSMVKYVPISLIIVDQEVGGSIPPSRTIFFNNLAFTISSLKPVGVPMGFHLNKKETFFAATTFDQIFLVPHKNTPLQAKFLQTPSFGSNTN